MIGREPLGPRCPTRWGLLAVVVTTAGCGSPDPPSVQVDKPSVQVDAPETFLKTEIHLTLTPHIERKWVEEFALSEAKRLLAPGLDERSSVEFESPREAKTLGEGSEAFGRLYTVAGEFDARDTSDVLHRYRWSAVVGFGDLGMTLAKLEVSQDGEEPSAVYTDPDYEAESQDHRPERDQ